MILMFDIVLENKQNFAQFAQLSNGESKLGMTLNYLLCRRVLGFLELCALLGVRVLDPPVDGEAEHPRVPEGGAVELRELGPVLGELGPGGGGQDQCVHPHAVPRGLSMSEMWLMVSNKSDVNTESGAGLDLLASV